MKKKSILLIILVMLISVCLLASGCMDKKVTETPTLDSANFVFERVATSVIESTVRVTCKVGAVTQGGSGVIVSSEGYILTNFHVIEGATTGEAEVYVPSLNSKYETKYRAKILDEIKDNSKYSKMDLAVLKIEDFNPLVEKFKPISLKTEQVKWGECGVIVGNPKQLGTSCAFASVSNPSRRITHVVKKPGFSAGYTAGFTTDFITLDAPVNPGNSGGGFFDSNGKLAGIVTLRQHDSSTGNSNEQVIFGIGYAIPADSVQGYLARYKIKL